MTALLNRKWKSGTKKITATFTRGCGALCLAMLKLLAQSQDSLVRTGRTYSTAEVRRRAKVALAKASNQ